MARIYPADASHHNPESPAEKRLYPLMKELPNDYLVVCDTRWKTKGWNWDRPAPAQADFVIAHPDRGVLVLEVKGGRIAWDPQTDAWASIDRNEVAHPIRDPFDQAQRISRLLSQMLELGSRERERLAGEAVAFPDCPVAPGDLPRSLRLEAVLDAEDRKDMRAGVERAFDACGLKGNGDRFGPQGVARVERALCQPIELRSLGAQAAQDDQAELFRLTQSQIDALAGLMEHQRVSVRGAAGTGKTLLAVEQARRLAAQGHQVLLTCFNTALAGHLTQVLSEEPLVHVSHFHGLCRELAQEAGVLPRRGSSARDYLERGLPDALFEAAGLLRRRYDAVLVDEAQDFGDDWLASLELLLEDEQEGVLQLFGDANQAIYGRLPQTDGDFVSVPLVVNCRNTRAIHRILAESLGDGSRSRGPEGAEVELRAYSGSAEREIAAVLRRLVEVEGFAPTDITVLTPRAAEDSSFHDGVSLGRFTLRGDPTAADDIRVSTVHSFKGLESTVVVLVEMERAHRETEAELWYVAISRARTNLVVALPSTIAGGASDLRDVLTRRGVTASTR